MTRVKVGHGPRPRSLTTKTPRTPSRQGALPYSPFMCLCLCGRLRVRQFWSLNSGFSGSRLVFVSLCLCGEIRYRVRGWFQTRGTQKAGGQNRTDDLRFTKPLLYRLSHAGAGAIVAGMRRESSEPCSGRAAGSDQRRSAWRSVIGPFGLQSSFGFRSSGLPSGVRHSAVDWIQLDS